MDVSLDWKPDTQDNNKVSVGEYLVSLTVISATVVLLKSGYPTDYESSRTVRGKCRFLLQLYPRGTV